jgi:7,8-dihydropterin-6-yl-methyl-4-(beta-D-ribofuranosyl)aminobenzene 5'-phosphate synthase
VSGKEVKITVVCENTVGTPAGLTGEWGLAMLVETGGKKILFDTGERGEVVNNAASLGADLRAVDALVLSHGHYDHTGGLRSFLRCRGRLPVYAHPGLFAPHYVSLNGDSFIGVPYRREELASLGADFVFVREPVEIAPGLFVSGEVPRTTDFEEGDGRLFCPDAGGNKTADPLADDMSLYCVLPEGLLIILGCAHAGVVNIVRHARQVTGVDRVYGIIGGTHLGPVRDAQREATIAFLKELDLKFFAANHCTGLPVIARLAAVFGPRFSFAPAGSVFSLPPKENG